ncbi:MAG: PQQ-dependent sugar dehydrogenase [Deltaproteobacteria bacterium]|nr:PQQ-dependent sugar dehydrogenase [Deltaproteobacteria bacterium]
MNRTQCMGVALALGLTLPQAWGATPLTTVRVASGLTFPIWVTAPPGDYHRIFLIEKQGRIRIINNGNLLTTPYLNIDPIVGGGTSIDSEQGLLCLAFDPNYATNGNFYVNYTNNSGNTVIARYTVSADPNVADPNSALRIWGYNQPQANHNGGWLAFGPDGYLYIAAGDGGNSGDQGTGHTEPGGNAHDLTSNPLGKMHRIDPHGDDFPADPNRNYAIPPTNPFVGTGNDAEIWADGLRNPWRPSFDRVTGDLWIADVGQNAWEEIDFQPAGIAGGRDYGWRCKEGLVNYTFDAFCTPIAPGFTDPIYVYGHTGGACAITGGYVYRGCAIPDLQGTYFFADYCTAQIQSFKYVGGAVTQYTNRTTELAPGGGLSIASLTSFGEDAFGELYITDEAGGEVFKIVPRTMVGGDCNHNGRDDNCDIAAGLSLDANNNGLPDECECPGDLNGDYMTNLSDLGIMVSAYGSCTGDPNFNAAADLDHSGCVDLSDLAADLADYGCNG